MKKEKKQKPIKKGVVRVIQNRDGRFRIQIKKKSKNKYFSFWQNLFYFWKYLDASGKVVKNPRYATAFNKKRKAEQYLRNCIKL